MIDKEFAWECSCGHIEYGELSPDECPSCFKIDSFTQLPEELAEERERDSMVEEMTSIAKPAKLVKASKSVKSKPSLNKPTRKKKRK